MEENSNDKEQNKVKIDLGISPLNINEALDDSPMFRQSVIDVEEVRHKHIFLNFKFY